MNMEAAEGRRSAVKTGGEDHEDGLRRGPWTVEEDFKLINYIAVHGEGRWNSLARCAGLRRTGKSCRLRWLNYLRPDVRRGNITLEEQLLILELHSRWGNRWSKIAQYMPGRTDNEIKNYWRTRVQKHAKQLKCDVNSKKFKDTMRYIWMPRLVERIQAATTATTAVDDLRGGAHAQAVNSVQPQPVVTQVSTTHSYTYTPESSNTAASSDSFTVHQFSPASDQPDHYNIPMMNSLNTDRCIQASAGTGGSEQMVGSSGLYTGGSSVPPEYFGLQDIDQQMNGSYFFGGEDAGEQSLWNADDFWFLQQQLNNL